MCTLKKCFTITSMTILMWLGAAQANAQSLQVVSTFSIISDFARNVGGERIALVTLVGPDGDAHTYEPTPTDALAVGKADLILANGLYFEGFIDRLIKATDTTAPVITLTNGIRLLRNTGDEHNSHEDHDGHDHATGHDHEHAKDQAGHHHHGEYDPHAWQSVHNAQIYVNNIAEAFCAADEAGCQNYRVNAQSYGEKLQALDTELRASVAQIPSSKRTVITSHDAFAYLGHEYDLQFLAPQGVSTESEASAAGVASLIQQINNQKASAIFLENISNPRLVTQIANETGMKIGGKLYSDSLSTESGPAATYLDMIRHNVATIRDALLEP